MQLPDPNRREFSQWAAAAVGGLLGGLSAGAALGDSAAAAAQESH
jgi:hypothetical protein